MYKIAVDENIFIKNRAAPLGFIPPYSAAVISKSEAAGMEITDNKADADAMLGLCSCGEAYYRYAEINNLIYIKPGYGTVSRYGVIAHVSSADQVGVYAKNFKAGFEVLSVISGYDENDGTTYPKKKYKYSPSQKTLEVCEMPEFKLSRYVVPVYKIISAAEFGGNTSRFDGLRFGYRAEKFNNVDELVIGSRSEGFTLETKLKIMLGAFVTLEGNYEKYYLKAAELRRLIALELDGIFEKFDAVIMPAGEEAAALAALTGCPAVFVKGKIIIAKMFDEDKLFRLGEDKINEL
ncbi:MAG: amidase family protein [Oscillospiraceae bacterium]|nr:amidase family protein [Oscillospiraceae bacterium]